MRDRRERENKEKKERKTLTKSMRHDCIREAAKKVFFSGPAIRRGGGGKGLATKMKDLF